MSNRELAAFDFDGTLLAGDTLLIAHRLLQSWPQRLAAWVMLLPHLAAWTFGRQSTAAFKARYLNLIFNGTTVVERQRVLRTLLPQALEKRLRPEALARLQWHNQQGHRLVIVTASPRALVEPLAEQLGVELIATETSDPLRQSRVQPLQLETANCKGIEKVRRLEAWLGEQSAPPLASTVVHAYGDSRGDRELLQASAWPHWRSFSSTARPYPSHAGSCDTRSLPWVSLIALGLLGLAITGLSRLAPADQGTLQASLVALLPWLPVLYGGLVVSYGLRYWRWRVLLGSQAIGQPSWPDLHAWFCGFALTATPAKLGELSRVQQLHQRLGYPRSPLVQVFVAERLSDLAAVTALLLLLLPGQRWGLVVLGVVAVSLASAVGWGGSRLRQRPMGCRLWQRWRHHLPSGRLAKATLPATFVAMLVWCTEALLFWGLVRILGATPLPLPVAISIYLLSGTAGIASSLPGGVGVNEATTVFLLGLQGIGAGVALPIAIVRRLITPWSVVVVAALVGLGTKARLSGWLAQDLPNPEPGEWQDEG